MHIGTPETFSPHPNSPARNSATCCCECHGYTAHEHMSTNTWCHRGIYFSQKKSAINHPNLHAMDSTTVNLLSHICKFQPPIPLRSPGGWQRCPSSWKMSSTATASARAVADHSGLFLAAFGYFEPFCRHFADPFNLTPPRSPQNLTH